MRHFLCICLLLVLPLPALASTVIYLDGQGDSIWGNQTTFDGTSGDTLQVTSPYPNIVDIEIIQGGPVLLIELATPTGSTFAPGTYADAVGSGGRDAFLLLPGISATNLASSRGCNFESGWLKVYEADIDAKGNINKLAVDFLHNCDGEPGNLIGAVRVNSSVPVPRPQPYAFAGRPLQADQGSTVTLDAVDSVSRQMLALSYQWQQTSGPSVSLTNATSSAATFTAPQVAAGGQTLGFQLTVTDANGQQDTDSTSVIVHNPQDPQTRAFLHSPIGEPLYPDIRLMYAPSQTKDTQDLLYTFSGLDWNILANIEGPYYRFFRFDLHGNFKAPPGRNFGGGLFTPGGEFESPDGADMSTLLYKDAQRQDANSTVFPYISFGGEFGCNTEVGAFQVLELEYPTPPAGMGVTNNLSVTKLAFDYVEYCIDDASASFSSYPPVTGSVRINSNVPLHDGLVPPLAFPTMPSAHLTVSPLNATVGQTVTFSWNSTNTDYCYGFNGFPASGALPTSGSVTTTYSYENAQQFWVECFTSGTAAKSEVRTLTISNAQGSSSGGGSSNGGGGGGGAMDASTLLALMLGWRLKASRRRRA